MKTVLIFLFMTMTTFAQDDIQTLAIKSMQSQIIKLDEGYFYKAGSHQFNTLWTRDFAYSIESLLFHDKDQVVHDHLDFLLTKTTKEGLVPLYADSTQPMARVALSSLKVILPFLPDLKLKSPLKVYYKVSGRYPVIDSNALVLIGAARYLQKTKDADFLKRHREELLRVFHYYDAKKSPDGFIYQDPFSDWQDSAKREGEIFLTQLLYWKAGVMLEEVLQTELFDQEVFKNQIKETFFHSSLGLFVVDPNDSEDRRALEDQLLAIRFGLVEGEEALSLYETLKADKLWTASGPGRPTFPSYNKDDINWYVKLSGVKDYHGPLHWSWLWGLTGLVAKEMHDQKTIETLTKQVSSILKRDGAVGEVYFPDQKHELFKSKLYRSEKPFGWGSAYIAHFLNLN